MTFNDDFIVVCQSQLHGKGLFTKKQIEKGTIIIKIIGEEVDELECIRRENEENNVYIFYKNDNCYVDVSNNEKLRYLNHSCKSNCYVDEDQNGELVLIASRDIEAYEELTIDYGFDEIYQLCKCDDCNNKIQLSNNLSMKSNFFEY
jgi:SET domain-containing protein